MTPANTDTKVFPMRKIKHVPKRNSEMKARSQKISPTQFPALLAICMVLFCAYAKAGRAGDFVDYVDPWIESDKSRFFFFASACRPFGMVNLSPDSRIGETWNSGYHYSDPEILGFSHVHAWMLSGITVMPTSGSIDPTKGVDGWKSPKDVKTEIVQAGYHRVHLDKYAIGVELSSTDRVGFYRLTHEKPGTSSVLFNLSGQLGQSTMRDALIRRVSDTELVGYVTMTGRIWGPHRVRIYFVARFDKAFSDLKGWQGKAKLGSIRENAGDGIGAVVEHPVAAGEVLQMKVAISYTSIANARLNLETELKHWNFDQVKQESRDVWNDWLGKIEVTGGTKNQRIKFYTDLWHVLLGRRKLNDVNGMYPDNTGFGIYPNQIDTGTTVARQLPLGQDGKPLYSFYNSDAFWLTQWNVNLVWGMAYPQVLNEFVNSALVMYRNGGLLPRGPCAGGYTGIMTGNSVTPLIVGAYMKGIRGYDVEEAFEAMVRNHRPGGMMGQQAKWAVNKGIDLDFYIKQGYDPSPGGAGTTLEYAYQDWCLAQMAAKLGKTAAYREFMKRSQHWKNLFHPDHKFIFPKDRAGQWRHTNPLNGRGFVEANSWQASWFVSHDLPGLARLMGGNDAFCAKLNAAFEQAAEQDFVSGYGSGTVSYANQPGCSNAHLFTYAGKPWLTQYWVRQVNEKAYGGVTPDLGYGGHDEDQGQMGGVSVLMSLGLFSVKGTCGQTPIYEITSPVFDTVEIHLDRRYYPGKRFKITTTNNSKENMYIQSARLDGQALNRAWFHHERLAAGAHLELSLGPEPNRAWGDDVEELP